MNTNMTVDEMIAQKLDSHIVSIDHMSWIEKTGIELPLNLIDAINACGKFCNGRIAMRIESNGIDTRVIGTDGYVMCMRTVQTLLNINAVIAYDDAFKRAKRVIYLNGKLYTSLGHEYCLIAHDDGGLTAPSLDNCLQIIGLRRPIQYWIDLKSTLSVVNGTKHKLAKDPVLCRIDVKRHGIANVAMKLDVGRYSDFKSGNALRQIDLSKNSLEADHDHNTTLTSGYKPTVRASFLKMALDAMPKDCPVTLEHNHDAMSIRVRSLNTDVILMPWVV